MKRTSLVWLIIAFCLLGLQHAHSADDVRLGESLVQKFWSTSKGNIPEFEKLVARGFQGMYQDGPRDKTQIMKLVEKLDLDDYTLSDMKITRNGPVIVATYFSATAETINDRRIPRTKAARITVFLKTSGGWQAIAHANLVPLKK